MKKLLSAASLLVLLCAVCTIPFGACGQTDADKECDRLKWTLDHLRVGMRYPSELKVNLVEENELWAKFRPQSERWRFFTVKNDMVVSVWEYHGGGYMLLQ